MGNIKCNDLLGQKFGRLVVIEKTAKRDKQRCVIWKCKCDCGNEALISSVNLRRGKTKSCGCYNREISSLVNTKDLLGQRFGRLTVIERTNKRQARNVVWKCKCDCGNIIEVIGSSLTRGNTQSCGCYLSKGEEKIAKLLRENNIAFEQQKSFPTCRFIDTNALAYFDFWVDNRYLIEFDGSQHFEYSGRGWNTEEKFQVTQEHDMYKNQWCKENNIPLIRIPYTKYNSLTIKDLLL